MTTTKRIISIAFAAATLVASVFQANADKPKNVLDLKNDITDSNIIYPASYELDTQKMLEGWYMKNYTATDDRYKKQSDVTTSDATIRDRLSKLNTVIDMPFNQIVRSYIDRYTSKNRGGVAAMLGLGIYYMPIFEQALEEKGLPLELKYLPVIESGLNPNAVSRSGAGGLWQFMVVTGKGMGLEVSSLVDERRDPYLSSKKAADYLKSLYDTYGDWSLAIAAYNCGPGTVNKAIRRAGGDPKDHDYWSIYYYLPAETRGYVPMFIAANYVMNYYQYHNISPVLATKPLVTDTLMISNRVHFNQISKVLDIPVDELRVLNPQFRADLIPGRPDRQYTLVLPSQQVHAYIMSEDAILSHDAARYAQRTDATPGEMPGETEHLEISADELVAEEAPLEPAPKSQAPVRKTTPSGGTKTISHKVEPGQSLAEIAEMYEVSPDQIKIWNNLSRNSVRTGQMLRITTTPELAKNSSAREVAPSQQQTASRTKKDSASSKKHTAQENTQSKKNDKSANKAETAQNVDKKGKKGKKDAETAQNVDKKGKKGKKNAETAQNVGKKGKKGKKNVETAQETGKKGKRNKKKAEPAQPSDHSVKSGENLTTIAKKYGTTVSDLKKANGMTDDKLQPGDKLKLPSKKKAGKNKAEAKSSKGKKGKADAAESKSSKKKSSAKSGSKSKKKKR